MFWKQNNSELSKNDVLLLSEIAKIAESTWYKGICEEGINTNDEVIALDSGVRQLFRNLAKFDKTVIDSQKHIALVCLANKYDAIYPWNDIITNIGGHKLTPLDFTSIKASDIKTNKMIFIDNEGKNTNDETKAIGILNNCDLVSTYIDEALEMETLIQSNYIPNFRKMYEAINVLDEKTPLISLNNNKYLDKITSQYGNLSSEELSKYNKNIFETLSTYDDIMTLADIENKFIDEKDKEINNIIDNFDRDNI